MAQLPSIPKGTRDYSPEIMVKRNYIFDTIKSVFKLYGYMPLETPAMENLSTLMGKYGEEGFSTNERTGIRPTFDVCGIWGGYTGEGAKTVLPSVAHAKISCRLVPNQKHDKIAKLFQEYFESIAPEYVKVKVSYLHGGPSYVCPIDLPAYKAAEKAYEEVYGKKFDDIY